MDKKVILIAGPTAVGKTAMALQLARYYQVPILSADSRQCFRELNIGVAKPSPEELKSVPHYFVNSHSIHEQVNAALFEELALQWSKEIFLKKDVLVLVGGTGLYINAFCEGLDEIPVVEEEMRSALQSKFEQSGIGWLKSEVKKLDPAFYASGEILNPQRLMRALEVKLFTGHSILSFMTRSKKKRPFQIIKIGLQLPKERLQENIDARVNNMIKLGLLAEAKDLYDHRHLNALQTVGYSELFAHLEGRLSLDEAVELIKKNTRHYAKRQLTWFRKEKSMHWLETGDWRQLKKITEL